MTNPEPCDGCRNGATFHKPISMAYQPIVSLRERRVFAYEALVRGTDGSGAAAVFQEVTDKNRYLFDQVCRSTAIDLASRLGLAGTGAFLSINFLTDAVYDPRACIRVTLEAAERAGFPTDRIMFEFTEAEKVEPAHLLNILRHYRSLGFLTAIDDFGAGYAGLGLLCDFVPDVAKLDMHLIRDCDTDPTRRKILAHTVSMLRDLGSEVICEGIETPEEAAVLQDMDVDLMQGYLFAKPAYEALPAIAWPELAATGY
ncbi:EAL domain, c-di-GMP-specific phosphodiesterase class I (or its enzymatically inactive variant) [Salinihabitans flavidus]|uniref:EAL domain, c-di-GMP-specific phosphodiesterase class I (Or its enzymatically inactive variant) n=1 Tax=Salinihabitans flavidus TaxID=569882 RepID=A0A1H8T4P0_9RHOB|nr:EAL domain-containing protein [Salinihabitans flavidus]SEO85842.1 EAL domain, c-di-GMP-specific phosphodiesterase class I (or its enzymatically inactive variant) [Salinihabitans flavidus]